jgi:hypothetical protein
MVIHEMGILASQTAHKTTSRVQDFQNVSANFSKSNIQITNKFIVRKNCKKNKDHITSPIIIDKKTKHSTKPLTVTIQRSDPQILSQLF